LITRVTNKYRETTRCISPRTPTTFLPAAGELAVSVRRSRQVRPPAREEEQQQYCLDKRADDLRCGPKRSAKDWGEPDGVGEAWGDEAGCPEPLGSVRTIGWDGATSRIAGSWRQLPGR
jgi:hypothetical protein